VARAPACRARPLARYPPAATIQTFTAQELTYLAQGARALAHLVSQDAARQDNPGIRESFANEPWIYRARARSPGTHVIGRSRARLFSGYSTHQRVSHATMPSGSWSVVRDAVQLERRARSPINSNMIHRGHRRFERPRRTTAQALKFSSVEGPTNETQCVETPCERPDRALRGRTRSLAGQALRCGSGLRCAP
jgi:hypothetical protein